MTKVQFIEKEITKLSPEELSQLRDLFFELDAEQWDRQLERDAESGKLEKLFEKSTADRRAGKSRGI